MRRVLFLLLGLLIAAPACAHSLRVFARVEGQTVSGYAFFIGGGRPVGAKWSAKMGAASIASGTTAEGGTYSFTAPSPVTDAIAVTVDTGEGHFATVTLGPERFGASPLAVGSAVSAPQALAPAAPDAQATARLVEAAVERQVAPLLERMEAMDARMRFTDILSGLFLIIGLAGMALWARGRRS